MDNTVEIQISTADITFTANLETTIGALRKLFNAKEVDIVELTNSYVTFIFSNSLFTRFYAEIDDHGMLEVTLAKKEKAAQSS